MGPGDNVIVLDGQGRVYNAIIKNVSKDDMSLAIVHEVTPDTEPAVKAALFQAVPKGEKMDFVVQKATELGVSRIVPMITERVIVRPDTAQATRRRERWQRIAREASRQCGRTVVPVIERFLPFESALELLSPGFHHVMPWEGEEQLTLRHFLRIIKDKQKPLENHPAGQDHLKPEGISIFIGPEGGFSLAEVEAARNRGITTVSLGRRILRTETAGIITLALVLYTFGEIG
jgi:16S rRNA (uracil1498-N3)-methyltransferase